MVCLMLVFVAQGAGCARRGIHSEAGTVRVQQSLDRLVPDRAL